MQLAVEAREPLEAEGIATRVVSMPCRGVVRGADHGVPGAGAAARRQGPGRGRGRACRQGWRDIVGDAGEIVSIDHFGASADANTLFREFGFTAEAVVAARRQQSPATTVKGRVNCHDLTARTQAPSPTRASPSGSTTCPASGSRPATSQELIDTKHVVGVTTNPSIFQAALAKGDGVRRQSCASFAADGKTVDEAVFGLTTQDVRNACDILRPVYDATDGVDGRVSIEVDPRLAHDTGRTVAEAKELAAAVDRAERPHQDPRHRRGPAGDLRRCWPRASASTSR